MDEAHRKAAVAREASLRAALLSIARSTCCHGCMEASLVAKYVLELIYGEKTVRFWITGLGSTNQVRYEVREPNPEPAL